jgi:hypothetical protein
MKTRLCFLAPAPVNDECIRRDQEDFEEYEEIEKVSGQKSAIDAHDLKQEQRIVERPLSIFFFGTVQPGAKGEQCGQGDQQGRQAVNDKQDAERRLPAPQGVGKRFTLCLQDQYPPMAISTVSTPQATQRCMLSRVDRGGNSIAMPASDGSNTGSMGKWFMKARSLVE